MLPSGFKGFFSLYVQLLEYIWCKTSSGKKRIIIVIIFILITVKLNILAPLIFKYTLSYINELDDTFFKLSPLWLLLGYALIRTLSNTCHNLREILALPIIEKAVSSITFKIFEKLHTSSENYYKNRKIGDIIAAIERAQTALPDLFWWMFFYIIPVCIELILAIILISYYYGFQYTIILLISLLVYFALTYYILFKYFSLQVASNKVAIEVNSWIIDSLINYENIRYYLGVSETLEEFSKQLKKRETLIIRSRLTREMVGVFQAIIIGICLVFTIILAGDEVLKGIINVSDLVLINSYILQFAGPLSTLGIIIKHIKQGFINIKSAHEILSLPNNFKLGPQDEIEDLKFNNLRFNNVNFSYNVHIPILKDLNFNIEKGKFLAIIGESGAGKTSILRLILKSHTPTNGSIFLGKENISNITSEIIWNKVSFIPQDITLFNDTLLFNLTFGKTVDNNELLKVIDLLNLNELIEKLPYGLKTIVGERGVVLSGGEKQKIAFGRALLKKSDFYIFDEPTSSFDTFNIANIKKILETNLINTTRIVVTHNLKFISNADKIIVLKKGKIVEQGTHRKLINAEGYYYKLWLKK